MRRCFTGGRDGDDFAQEVMDAVDYDCFQRMLDDVLMTEELSLEHEATEVLALADGRPTSGRAVLMP